MSETQTIKLPDILPLFPLSGCLLLPHGKLPLNIFEPRYLAMVDEAMARGRMIGVVQPKSADDVSLFPPLFDVGCAGKITAFSETADGRYLIQLQGMCRFKIQEELEHSNEFRRVRADWTPYLTDLAPSENPDYDRARLMNVLKQYFAFHNVSADWSVVQNTANEQLLSSLAMICPLEPNEKQALLEAPTIKARAELLVTLLEMACLKQDNSEQARH